MGWLKLLSLIVVAVALVAAPRMGERAAAAGADRGELPSGDPAGDPDDDAGFDAAPELTVLPPSFTAPTPIPAGRLILNPRTIPATSDRASRIFRPPISVRV